MVQGKKKMVKLSEELRDAIILGDTEGAERIKEEIASRHNLQKTAQNNTVKINTILNNEKASAIRIYDFLNKAFGEDWWEWEIETIERMLLMHYGTALEDTNRDKVLAIRHVCRSDGCFADWFEFNQIALAFSGSIADFQYLRVPSPGMVISAVKAMNYIRPERDFVFSNDVIKYICVILINDGVYVPPPSLVSIIGDKMKKMVSAGMVDSWMPALRRYNKLLNNQVEEIEDDPIDIQAKRLLKAEAASLAYSK